MDEYQARGWKAWHHHIALVLIAMLFVLEQELENQEVHPLLSSTDIKLLLTQFLPRRDATAEKVIRQMEVRHRQRQASTDSAYRLQRLRPGPEGNLTK